MTFTDAQELHRHLITRHRQLVNKNIQMKDKDAFIEKEILQLAEDIDLIEKYINKKGNELLNEIRNGQN